MESLDWAIITSGRKYPTRAVPSGEKNDSVVRIVRQTGNGDRGQPMGIESNGNVTMGRRLAKAEKKGAQGREAPLQTIDRPTTAATSDARPPESRSEREMVPGGAGRSSRQFPTASPNYRAGIAIRIFLAGKLFNSRRKLLAVSCPT